ncbi:Major facilitator superfamily [Mycobacteroides abscessus subsp. abscessus]|uniref:MFS transporter n=1 Tax=Mycobacteroides abscessus TaxID=36809 RepID=UPI00092A5565|nr:MFS transporter [Mycobacteroides abscessus]MBN7412243.1 MFS transporter [Mycobacteroides abscessus subsp. abscessus]MDM2348291.1 MFS transporter [Mycobacteroides abscessus]MDM2359293.1 MFS transporter [Mycobacteroides abscessus]QSN51999.1 MFS transporter [Mycobacteroides abscessus subsp. abscessus]SII01793.1 Major facilitator superfamily [Mycobacteroides abscessus subsp. abscessus]
MDRLNSPAVPQRLSAWRFVTTFGVISMLADIVYEGARSITGPLLASLGASALVVGVVTGIGEAAALALRLVSGPLTDRTRKFWAWTISGYALTVVTVPFLGVSSVLWIAATLVIAERVGKAVRGPAKDTLLSHATAVTGRGKGFAVHEAMDQIGAITGPLLVAGMLALTHVNYLPTFAILALPGGATLLLLFWLRRRVPYPERYEHDDYTRGAADRPHKLSLPLSFWLYSGFTAITMIGFATFGVLSFHMVQRGVLPVPAVPIVYAAAMAADAVAALLSGWAYDRVGPKSLAALPIVGATVPMLAFTDSLPGIVLGALLWGAAVGIQESTLRAVVADLVPPPRRATAYGVYAAVLGTATAIGGALTGYLYGVSIPMLIAVVGVIQLVALITAAPTLLRHAGQV